jgi:hypothetical protein
MPRPRSRAFRATKKTAKKPRITITMTPEVNDRLKAIAVANQRSVAWIINYAIQEVLDKCAGEHAPQLPARPSPPQVNQDE